MATAVPPPPVELDIHKQREAEPSGLVSLQSMTSTSSAAAGVKIKREYVCLLSSQRGKCDGYVVVVYKLLHISWMT